MFPFKVGFDSGVSEFTEGLVRYACVSCEVGGGTSERKSPGSCLITFHRNFILNVLKCSLQHLPRPFSCSSVPLAPHAIGGIASFLMGAR